jgi:hypothetical protein
MSTILALEALTFTALLAFREYYAISAEARKQ